MPRVSEYYRLSRSQPDLDFVDVDIDGDVELFIDPRALLAVPSEWAAECRSLVQNFFHTVLTAIKDGHADRARHLLLNLREPNETHLGLSVGRARGRALGPDSAHAVWEALAKSEAAKSGMLQDLEDTILLVPGIRYDIVSDITTNVIREPLIRYTNYVADYFGIPLQNDVASGPIWNPVKHDWDVRFVRMPVTSSGKLLLVPKAIVRRQMDYQLQEYYRDYIIEHLKHVELERCSELVHLLRDGRPRVFIYELEEKYGTGKHAVVQLSREYPEILNQYRTAKRQSIRPPLSHEEIADFTDGEEPDWDALLRAVIDIEPGRNTADAYHRAVERLLTALFYPSLTNPEVEYGLHEGRKRVDIRYTNTAQVGFFNWLFNNFPAGYVWVECKNYSDDVANEELDQLAGRFSESRGKVGLLISRGFKDKARFVERCRDTARDDRGFIVALDDADLKALVADVRARGVLALEELRKRFDELIN